jgi:hypothetical protein
MELSPVLNPQGDMIWSMGGRHSWKQFEYRGWNVSLEWVGSGRRAYPCMCIWPSSLVFAPGTADSGAWVISKRAIMQFVGFNKDDKCTGGPSVHCLRECHEALPILGKDANDKQALSSLMDAIVRFATDLVSMPPAPRSIRKELAGMPMWEVSETDKNSGKTLREATL